MSKQRQGKLNRQRGNAWAVEVAHRVNDMVEGADARRGLQGQGEHDTHIPDVVSNLPLYIECKTGLKVSIGNALEQVAACAPKGQYRAVVVRDRSRNDPENPQKRMEYVAMPLDDWLELVGVWWMECKPRGVTS